MLKSIASALLTFGLFVALAAPGQADTSVSVAQQGESLAPPVEAHSGSSLSGLFLAATLAETERDIPAAADFYRQAYELDPTSERFLQSAFLMELADGRMTGAMDLAAVLVAAGDSGISRFAMALDAVRQRSYRAALRELDAFQTDGFGDLLAVLVRAWVLHGNGDTDEALTALEALDGPAWVELFASYHSGLIRLANGNVEAALADLEGVYSVDPGTLRHVQAYARALVANDRPAKAREVLETFQRLVPFNTLVRENVDALETGRPIGKRVATPQQGAAEAIYSLSLALSQDGSEEISAIYLNLALFIDPDHNMARYELSRIYESLELWERAAQSYDGINPEHPLKRPSEIRLGILLDQLDRPDEADEHLQALIDSDPTDLEAINAFGTVLRVRRDFDRAAEVYSLAIDTLDEPAEQHWSLYYQRAIAYERTDRWSLAEADFLKALELSPEQPDVLNYLAYTWVDRGENLDRSIDMLERAVEARPDAGYIVDSLGWVYFRLGRFEEAVEQLERAVILDPSQAVIHSHLGDAYWMVGRRLEARFQWSHARDMEDEFDEIDEEEIQLKLQRGLTREEVEAVGTWPDGYVIPNVR